MKCKFKFELEHCVKTKYFSGPVKFFKQFKKKEKTWKNIIILSDIKVYKTYVEYIHIYLYNQKVKFLLDLLTQIHLFKNL